MTVVAAPVDVNRLGLVGEAQAFVNRGELQLSLALREIVWKVSRRMCGHFAEDDSASRALDDGQSFGHRCPETRCVIEMMVADDQVCDWFAWSKRSCVVDHRLGLTACV